MPLNAVDDNSVLESMTHLSPRLCGAYVAKVQPPGTFTLKLQQTVSQF